jgi:exonuclease III
LKRARKVKTRRRTKVNVSALWKKIMTIKIASLHAWLGLSIKKNVVKQLILNNYIDVLCLQETKIDGIIEHNLMSFNKYNYESESKNIHSRVRCYINSSLNCVRILDLEDNVLTSSL